MRPSRVPPKARKPPVSGPFLRPASASSQPPERLRPEIRAAPDLDQSRSGSGAALSAPTIDRGPRGLRFGSQGWCAASCHGGARCCDAQRAVRKNRPPFFVCNYFRSALPIETRGQLEIRTAPDSDCTALRHPKSGDHRRPCDRDQISARRRTGAPVASFTLGRPTTSVAPAAGTLSRLATFSSPQRPAGSQTACVLKSLDGP